MKDLRWLKVTVVTQNDAVDAIDNFLSDLNTLGIAVDRKSRFRVVINAYFNFKRDPKVIVTRLRGQIQKLPGFGLRVSPGLVHVTVVDDHKWALAWEKYYHPFHVTRFITIVPSWQSYDPNACEMVIHLDPKRAFGTGLHPTTKLSLQALEITVHGGETMFDVGTGSGILSIAASKLGVKQIQAFDVTNAALSSAERNLRLNHVTHVAVKHNDLLSHCHTPVDLIVANVLPVLLMRLIPQVPALLKAHGRFLLSGIIDSKLSKVEARLRQFHFQIVEILAMRPWYAIIAKKGN